jgi:hypothetical protein
VRYASREFSRCDVMVARLTEVIGNRVREPKSAAVPNAIARFLHVSAGHYGKLPHAYFGGPGWSEGHPLRYLLRIFAFCVRARRLRDSRWCCGQRPNQDPERRPGDSRRRARPSRSVGKSQPTAAKITHPISIGPLTETW